MKNKKIEFLLKRWKTLEETATEYDKCDCGARIVRHVSKELNQTREGRWFVEYCEGDKCDYWTCGFLKGEKHESKT